jgi:hypothetical protein
MLGYDGSNAPLKLLSSHLRPMLVDSWMKKRNTMLSGNAERRRNLLDNLQKQIDEVSNLCIHLHIGFVSNCPFLLSFLLSCLGIGDLLRYMYCLAIVSDSVMYYSNLQTVFLHFCTLL